MFRLLSALFLIYLYHSRTNLCPFGDQSVCGMDSRTYSNPCKLLAASIGLLHYGPCTSIITPNGSIPNCPALFQPVCGRDAITYANECRLYARGIELAHTGPCNTNNYVVPANPLNCSCDYEIDTRCSLNEVNYENSCVLNCHHQVARSLDPCDSGCNCERKYDPVCGVDGLTYDNQCSLDCVRLTKTVNGECPSLLHSCDYCSKIPLPVCGENNYTYLNLCTIACKGVKLKHFGKCRDTEDPANNCHICSDIRRPICGTDGKNYHNECQCVCQKECQKYSDGMCPDPDAFLNQHCYGEIDFVCGDDGKTYDNLCFLDNSDTVLRHHGRCPDLNLLRNPFQTIEDQSRFPSKLLNY